MKPRRYEEIEGHENTRSIFGRVFFVTFDLFVALVVKAHA
jgi:hypothetical protein